MLIVEPSRILEKESFFLFCKFLQEEKNFNHSFYIYLVFCVLSILCTHSILKSVSSRSLLSIDPGGQLFHQGCFLSPITCHPFMPEIPFVLHSYSCITCLSFSHFPPCFAKEHPPIELEVVNHLPHCLLASWLLLRSPKTFWSLILCLWASLTNPPPHPPPQFLIGHRIFFLSLLFKKFPWWCA